MCNNKFNIPVDRSNLDFTGERFVPGESGAIEMEHIHRYLFASGLCQNKAVLDIASGEGFGSYILSQCASNVTGVDISQEAVDHANSVYQAPNLKYMLGSCQSIPLEDYSIDIVISFETLEHIVEHDEFFAEIKRVLKPDGLLIMSTPDTAVYSGGMPTQNHFHLKELFMDEFEVLSKKHFAHVHMFLQKCILGSTIQHSHKIDDDSILNNHNNYFTTSTPGIFEQKKSLDAVPYLIIVASDSEVDHNLLDNSFMEGNLSVNKIDEIMKEWRELADINKMCNKRITELEEENRALQREAHAANIYINGLLNSTSWKVSKPIRVIKNMISTRV